MVYACFVAKMSKMAFTRFGGQFQFEKSNGGQVRQFWGRDENLDPNYNINSRSSYYYYNSKKSKIVIFGKNLVGLLTLNR